MSTESNEMNVQQEVKSWFHTEAAEWENAARRWREAGQFEMAHVCEAEAQRCRE